MRRSYLYPAAGAMSRKSISPKPNVQGIWFETPQSFSLLISK
jgi:hypothetical protein